MNKIFLVLLLPARLAYGQQLKPDNIPAFGSDNQLDTHSIFHIEKGKLLLEDSNTDKVKSWFQSHTNSFSGATVFNGRFSYWTQDGSAVYKIQPDNIPCLVPQMDRLEKMPVIRSKRRNAIEPMPNVGPRIELMPKIAGK
jgi:hypothetical protein